MRYLITVAAGARRVSPRKFACESAFAQHLRELKQELGPRWSELVVAMPYLDDPTWQKLGGELTEIDEVSEQIRFEPLYRFGCGRAEFMRELPKMVPRVVQLTREADFIHSNFSYDIFRPVGALFCMAAVAYDKRVIAIDDIDRRRDAEMFYRTGRWSKRKYLMSRYIYDPLRDWLARQYVRHVDMMLFKELQQVEDYGQGKGHVRLFLDPNFSEEHVANDTLITLKQERLRDTDEPLRVLYFGRLVPYKGVDKMVEAVARARARGARLTFSIMGSGEQETQLRSMCDHLGLGEHVRFIAPKPYGDDFFDVLRDHDVLLACPLSGDTPRSTWDALASGMPLVAFDTPFYRSMAAISKAIELTPWPEVEPLAVKLHELATHKERLIPQVSSAVATARDNSGSAWLKRRVAWVEELIDQAS